MNTYTTWAEAESSFDDLIDLSGPIVILGVEYDRSRILRKVDPIAYLAGLHAYIDVVGDDSDDYDGEPSV